jgi:hypothetical protein
MQATRYVTAIGEETRLFIATPIVPATGRPPFLNTNSCNGLYPKWRNGSSVSPFIFGRFRRVSTFHRRHA